MNDDLENTKEHTIEVPSENVLVDFGLSGPSLQDSVVEALAAAGQGGTGGTGFIPRRTSFFGSLHLNAGMPWPSATANYNVNATGNLINNSAYLAYAFVAHDTYTVNRVAYRLSATASPTGYTVKGGICLYDASTGLPSITSDVINFASSGTTNTHISGNYHIINISDYSLQAGSTYCVAFQVTAIGGGSISFSRDISGTAHGVANFPCMIQRTASTGAGAKSATSSHSTLTWGYNDGSTTKWYGYPFDLISTTVLPMNRTSAPVYVEVGAKIKIQHPVQEFLVRGIAANTLINTTIPHTMACKIYGSDGTTQLANASQSINGAMAPTANANRWRAWIFPAPVRMLPYTDYYVMFSVTGSSTNTNPSNLMSAGTELTDTVVGSDMINVAVTRATAGGAISEVSATKAVLSLMIDDVYLGNRVGGSSSM